MRWGASIRAPLVPLWGLRRGSTEEPLVQHLAAGRADLAFNLVRDAGPLTEDVLRLLRVAVRLLPDHLCHSSQASPRIGGYIPQSGDGSVNSW
jgi:hypothetical protein